MNIPQPNAPQSAPPDEALLRNLLERVARGELTVDQALPQVRLLTNSAAATLQSFATLLQPAMQRQRAAAGWVVGIIFALIGTLFFCIGVGISWRTLQFMDAPQADGVIVAVAGGIPTAKYKVNNIDYQVHGKVSSKPPAYDVGDKVTVLYKADNPGDAQIDGFVERWLFLIIFGGIGAVFGLIGWGMLFFKLLGRLFRSQPMALDGAQRFTIE